MQPKNFSTVLSNAKESILKAIGAKRSEFTQSAPVFMIALAAAPAIPPLFVALEAILIGGLLVYGLFLLFTEKGKGKAIGIALMLTAFLVIFFDGTNQGPLTATLINAFTRQLNALP